MSFISHVKPLPEKRAGPISPPIREFANMDKYPFSFPVSGRNIRYIAKPVKK